MDEAYKKWGESITKFKSTKAQYDKQKMNELKKDYNQKAREYNSVRYNFTLLKKILQKNSFLAPLNEGTMQTQRNNYFTWAIDKVETPNQIQLQIIKGNPGNSNIENLIKDLNENGYTNVKYSGSLLTFDYKLKDSMAKGGEVNEEEIIDKLEEQFRGKDLWEDEILDEYEVKMFDFEEFNDEETFYKWKNKNSKKNYIVPFESDDDSYIFILVPKNKMEDGGEVSKAGELKSKIEKILDKVLPGFYKNVFVRKNYFDKGESIGIIMAASNYEINRVKGQYPQDVSLMLDVEEMDLKLRNNSYTGRYPGLSRLELAHQTFSL
jgi:hypothetical protein